MQQFDLIPEKQQLPPQPPTRSGTFWRGAMSGVFAFLALAALSFGLLLIGYAVIASRSNLPAPDELDDRTQNLAQSILIYDAEGNLLNEAFGENDGRRTYIPYERIPKDLVNATVATEDENFFRPPWH